MPLTVNARFRVSWRVASSASRGLPESSPDFSQVGKAVASGSMRSSTEQSSAMAGHCPSASFLQEQAPIASCPWRCSRTVRPPDPHCQSFAERSILALRRVHGAAAGQPRESKALSTSQRRQGEDSLARLAQVHQVYPDKSTSRKAGHRHDPKPQVAILTLSRLKPHEIHRRGGQCSAGHLASRPPSGENARLRTSRRCAFLMSSLPGEAGV